ncbi:MAG TPA: DNA mismatch repair protein MutS, partial [Sumerlaeia bacterium]|nr:DNA mismatch repair protein MutS [Sumerlaeia bacterium]
MARAKRKEQSPPNAPAQLTPMVRQYNAIKAQYPNYILMFRMGDFFEMFGDDARTAAPILGITLTKRPWGEGGEMALAGVPFHAVEGYLAKFIRAGRKVAICDQTEDPKKAKGIVRREVVRLVTPGTILESELLDDKTHNFLVSACERKDGRRTTAAAASPSDADRPPDIAWGLAVTDLSTGSFEIAEFSGPDAARQTFSEIGRLRPAEVLLPDSLRRREGAWLDPSLKIAFTWIPDTDYEPASARRRLLDQFQVQSLEGYGAEGLESAISAAGALVQYLRDTQMGALRNVNHLHVYRPTDYLVLDMTTQRSLELVEAIHGGRSGALL